MESFPIRSPELADSNAHLTFPDGFLWGACTSGLQHEGSVLADGAGRSAMYDWAHAAYGKDKVSAPDWFSPPIDTFDDSADFYRRFATDIELIRQMNLNAYSFEVYWPRVLPDGMGRVNERGLDFYDRLVDAMLAANIEPLCNLYVFDHPSPLQERGGWLNRDMAKWFADYARLLFDRLGDRVPYWSTICEIPLVSFYTSGTVGGNASDESGWLLATHHVLLGQGMAVQTFRASGARGAIGNQHNFSLVNPASDDEEDVAAAALNDARSNGLYLDPVMRAEYPQLLIDSFGSAWPADRIEDGDLETIAAPIDYLGINYGHGQGEDMGADITASFRRLRERYGDIPILILEAGCPVEETVIDGRVDDAERVAYLDEYLTAVHRAIQEGVDIRGCFVWSWLDGWEFGYGLSLRYGLVHVDFATQERIVKASGGWYAAVAGANGFAPPILDA